MRRLKTAKGYLLVELLCAFLVLIIAAVWLLAAYQSSIHLSEVSQQTSVAVDDLKDMMEKIKATPFTQLGTSFPNNVINGTGNAYNGMVGNFLLPNEQITVTHSPNTTADPRELSVLITWTNRGRTYQRQISTFRASKAS